MTASESVWFRLRQMPKTPKMPRRAGQAAMERFIKDEVARRYRSAVRFFKKKEFPSATFYRVISDSPSATPEQRRHLEGALELPRNVLDYIADRNIEALKRTALDPDQLRVIVEYLHADDTDGDTNYAHGA